MKVSLPQLLQVVYSGVMSALPLNCHSKDIIFFDQALFDHDDMSYLEYVHTQVELYNHNCQREKVHALKVS